MLCLDSGSILLYRTTSDSESRDESSGDVSSGLARWKRDLAKSLDAIETFGYFACLKHDYNPVNPGLEVNGSGLIPLPLVPRDAEVIKGSCQQAPFGRGEETVVDTSVRKTWELSTDQFKLSNPTWKSYLQKVLREATSSLGMSVELIPMSEYSNAACS